MDYTMLELNGNKRRGVVMTNGASGALKQAKRAPRGPVDPEPEPEPPRSRRGGRAGGARGGSRRRSGRTPAPEPVDTHIVTKLLQAAKQSQPVANKASKGVTPTAAKPQQQQQQEPQPARQHHKAPPRRRRVVGGSRPKSASADTAPAAATKAAALTAPDGGTVEEKPPADADAAAGSAASAQPRLVLPARARLVGGGRGGHAEDADPNAPRLRTVTYQQRRARSGRGRIGHNKTRVDPRSRIQPDAARWNTSTAYRPPESVLWAVAIDEDERAHRHLHRRPHSAASSRPRGKKYAGAHIMRAPAASSTNGDNGGSNSSSNNMWGSSSGAQPAAPGRPRTAWATASAASKPRAATAPGNARGATTQQSARRRPASAHPRGRTGQGGAGSHTKRSHPRLTRPRPFNLSTTNRLGRREYAASYNVYNPHEACAVMFDFPDVPRRSTEEAARRLLPYPNWGKAAPAARRHSASRHGGKQHAGNTATQRQEVPQVDEAGDGAGPGAGAGVRSHAATALAQRGNGGSHSGAVRAATSATVRRRGRGVPVRPAQE